MYEHFLLDNKPTRKSNGYIDPDYDKEEGIQQERFDDPNFDKAWDSDDYEEEDIDVVAEKLPESVLIDDNPDDNDDEMDDIEDWAEVD